jgi:FkbH-like protein/FkbM family methyltransferase
MSTATQGLTHSTGPARSPEHRIVVAATFTAEPIAEVFEFWARVLHLPITVNLAPFGQVFQQLLDAGSVLRSNQLGAALLLLRLEDWAPSRNPAAGVTTSAAEHASKYRLPNGLEIAHWTAYETEYLYQEIFEQRVYTRRGITIEEGDCVFDVGANIGIFSIFARSCAPDVRVLAFEPSPGVAAILRSNAARAGGIQVFECGVSAGDGQAEFSFYPKSSVFSSFQPDAIANRRALQGILDKAVETAGVADVGSRAAITDELLEHRLDVEVLSRPVRSLSSIIDQEDIKYIHLLKIDAERSEWQVLEGLRPEHWDRVGQIVTEVHDERLLSPLSDLLRSRGFDVSVETADALDRSGFFNLYARRPHVPRRATESCSLTAAIGPIERAAADFERALVTAAHSMRTPLIVVWCPASPDTGKDPGIAAQLSCLEDRLTAKAQEVPGIHVIRSSEITALYSLDRVHDPHGLDLAHIPYTPAFYSALGTSVMRKFCALRHAPPKMLVVDADDTLWAGACGEIGPLGVQIDDSRREFHQFLIEQASNGVLLCVCSKNRLEDVLDVFRQNPGMKLHERHVARWRVGWGPKSAALSSLASEFGFGLDSVVMLDDNPVECAEVRANAPGSLVIQVPRDSEALARFVRHVWIFDRPALTTEDALRAGFYADGAARERLRDNALGFEDFLAALELRCDIGPVGAADLERVAQLTQRTNQFNLAKHPYTAAEIRSLVAGPGTECLVVRVADRFGDYGLVGVIMFRLIGLRLRVSVFMLSCRALGRGVEHQMLQELAIRAKAQGASAIELPFIASDRNEPMKRFLESLDGIETCESVYSLTPDAASRQRPVTAANSTSDVAPSLPPVDAARRAEQGPVDGGIFQYIAENLATVPQIHAAMKQSSRKRTGAPESAPADPLRNKISRIWSDALGLDSVGLHEDFLHLGGNSLKMVQATSCIREALQIRIPLHDAFKLRTVEEIARWIESQKSQDTTNVPDAIESEATLASHPSKRVFPLSHGQRALWYLYELAPSSWAYNVVFAGRCSTALNPTALRTAFVQTLTRHAALRTVYTIRAGQPQAVVLPEAELDFVEIDASAWDEAAIEEHLRRECHRPFDLRRGPIVRLRHYKLSGSQSALVLVAHHIALDLWSMELLIRDLLHGYADRTNGLQDSSAEYSDFVVWQDRFLAAPDGVRAMDYWLSQLNGKLPELNLQLGNPRSGRPAFTGQSLPFRLNAALTKELRTLAKMEGVTLYQVLLGAYASLLFRHTGQADIIVGSPFAGRDIARFRTVVGDFVNLVPIRIDLSGGPSFRELLGRISERVIAAIEHQHAPFPLLVQRLRARAPAGRIPIVQTSFALHEPQFLPGLGAFFLQGNREGFMDIAGLRLTPLGVTQQEGQFDLALEMAARDDLLCGAFKYDATLLDRSAAAQLAAHFESILGGAVAEPHRSISGLSLGSARNLPRNRV